MLVVGTTGREWAGRPPQPAADAPDDRERRRSEELLRKADNLVDLAVEVRDGMRRVTSLYEEREFGTAPEQPDER